MRTPKFGERTSRRTPGSSRRRGTTPGVDVRADGVEQGELVTERCATRSPSLDSEPASAGHRCSEGASEAPRSVRAKRNVHRRCARSMTPRRSPGTPTGQVRGVGRSPIDAPRSRRAAPAPPEPGRSYLLRNVSQREVGGARQTSNSFSVCASMPLAVSSTITTASTPASTRYVSSGEVAVAGGVEEVDDVVADRGNWSTASSRRRPTPCGRGGSRRGASSP